MSFEYPPERVVEGVKDFLAFELKQSFGDVEYRSGKIVVLPEVTIPEDVEEELRKILPPEYILVVED